MLLGSRFPKIVTFQTSAKSGASPSSPLTFSSEAIGVADANRRVVVAAHYYGSTGTVTAVTVGGVSADSVVTVDAGSHTTSMWIASVPTGTTADVVCTFGGSPTFVYIGIWSCGGLITNTPVDTDTSIADPGTATLTTVDGGFCISAGTTNNGISVTWTNITEDYDATGGPALSIATGASKRTTGANISPSADWSAAATEYATVFATW